MKRLIVLIISMFALGHAYSQSFVGGVEAGPIVSQYFGDGHSGYNKLSYKAGFFITRETKERLNYQIELYYIQKGSHVTSEDNVKLFNLRLRYLELPFSLKYRLKSLKIPGLVNKKFSKPVYLNLGLSYAYLLQANEDKGPGWQDATPYYYNYDFSWHFGFNFYLTNQLIVDLRFSHSLLPIRSFQRPVNMIIPWAHLNRNLQLTLGYQF